MKNNRKSSYSLEELVGKTVEATGIIGAKKHPSKVIDVTDNYVVLENPGFAENGSYGSTRVIPLHVLPSAWYKVVD